MRASLVTQNCPFPISGSRLTRVPEGQNGLCVFYYGLGLFVHELEQIVGAACALSCSPAALPAAKGLRAGPCSGRCSAFPVRVDYAEPYLLEELVLLSRILRKHPCC